MSKLISAFPATGKSYMAREMAAGSTAKASDSDYLHFASHRSFPENYISHIKNLLEREIDYIFVSAQPEVIKALQAEELDFVLVYPEKGLKTEWMNRLKNMEYTSTMLEEVSTNWDEWVDTLDKVSAHKKIVLTAGQYLSDVIDFSD